ncbi:MAG TPA: ATP synthase F1 subunit gamma [Candidatus Limnocylindrales bacterium]|nr:ATP synthase F1 subunit gamma [Candidatus Limnocylindrales bacterium]
MANTITLKRRIGSVKNTRQITKAMQLVAASKMRKAQEYALAGRTYREFAYSLLTRLSAITEVGEHPLFMKRPVKKRLYVVVTSNGTLAGAYNANIIRMLTRAFLADEKAGISGQVIAIGKQGAKFVRRVPQLNLLAAYTEIPDHPTANDIRPILNTAIEMYRDKTVDDVKVLYTQFKSNLVQEATALSLLPARFDDADDQENSLNNTTFEPSIEVVLDNVTERLLEVQVWQALLESLASEHSMRMIAMKNATDNAGDLIDDLTLAFNTARQAAITQELAEITGGAEAIQQ